MTPGAGCQSFSWMDSPSLSHCHCLISGAHHLLLEPWQEMPNLSFRLDQPSVLSILLTAKAFYVEVILALRCLLEKSNRSTTGLLGTLISFYCSPPHPAFTLWFSNVKPLLIPINIKLLRNSVYCICCSLFWNAFSLLPNELLLPSEVNSVLNAAFLIPIHFLILLLHYVCVPKEHEILLCMI